MRKILKITVLFLSLVSPQIPYANDLAPFLDTINCDPFFPGGMKKWKLAENRVAENNYLLRWVNSDQHEITLKYRNAEPITIQEVFKGIGEDIDASIKEVGGDVVLLKEFFAVVLMSDSQQDHSVNLIYGTTQGAYWWKYKTPNTFKSDTNEYINNISLVAREHQYDSALKLGNVVMGRWGGPVHEFAKLLASKNDPRTESVYMNLLYTSPSNYQAHAEFISVTNNNEQKVQSAKIIARDAEEGGLLSDSAEILKKETPSISAYPFLSKEDKGLEVILIPLSPCNPWLLDDIAVTYETITKIPVVIRRLPSQWNPPKPSRSAYRPFLEKIASSIWKTRSGFSDWSLARLKSEIMKKAEEEGPQAVTAINQIFKKMEEEGYQWDADPMMSWLSNAIVPYFSKDRKTMVVGITELDIFSGDSNFVFSVYGGLDESPVSILSYARMKATLTGETQSRKRLTGRAAKELVPASLKKLGIPRSTDPSCPYSYSSGLERLEEKTLILSDPVKDAIDKIRRNI